MPVSWKRIHKQVKKMKDKILEFLEILLIIIKSILEFALMMITVDMFFFIMWNVIRFIIRTS